MCKVISLQLIKGKCFPILVHGLEIEAFPPNKTQTQSSDFVVNRLFVKLFNTADIVIVKQCQEQFNFTLPSVALERRRTKFMHSFVALTSFTCSGRSIHVRSFVLTMHCHCIFSFVFRTITIFVVLHYHMWRMIFARLPRRFHSPKRNFI